MIKKTMAAHRIDEEELKKAMHGHYLDAICGHTFVDAVDPAVISRRIITSTQRKWRKDLVSVEDAVFLEFDRS